MKVTILGSGTCVPSLKRSTPGYLLEIGDKKILVDCGAGSLLQLEKIRPGLYTEIDYVFLTHTHCDHVAGVAPLIQALNWTPNFDRSKDLVLIGPLGFNQFYLNVLKPLAGNQKGTYEVKTQEIESFLDFDDFKVRVMKTKHSPNSIAYRFEEEDKVLVFSGDSVFNDNIIQICSGADLVILECSFAKGEVHPGHLNSDECGWIAKKAGVKKLVLTHFYLTSPEERRLAECKQIFENTILAEDLMEIEL